MSRRDEMVIRPTMGPDQQASARVEARDQRRLDHARGRDGLLRRLRALRLRRLRQKRLRTMRAEQRRTDVAKGGRAALRGGVRAVGGAASRGLTRAAGSALRNPYVLAAAAIAAVVVVGIRLGTGKSFEQMGSELNAMLLGNADDEARARMTVRHRFQSDEILTRIRSQSGQTNAQMNRIAQDLFRVEKQYEEGKSLIEREFGVNGTWDMLLLRGRDKFVEVIKSTGAQTTMNELISKWHSRYMQGGKKARSR
jgi:hypothetical protein